MAQVAHAPAPDRVVPHCCNHNPQAQPLSQAMLAWVHGKELQNGDLCACHSATCRLAVSTAMLIPAASTGFALKIPSYALARCLVWAHTMLALASLMSSDVCTISAHTHIYIHVTICVYMHTSKYTDRHVAPDASRNNGTVDDTALLQSKLGAGSLQASW